MSHAPPAAFRGWRTLSASATVLALASLVSGCTVITDDAYQWRTSDGGTTDGGSTDGGTSDGGCTELTWYGDQDQDGLGAPDVTQDACDQPDGFVDNGDDCDDSDASVLDGQTWYSDADGDSYGDEFNSTVACTAPDGYVATTGDCNDTMADVNIGMVERCDTTYDDDCDGLTNTQGAEACIDVFPDGDDDGFGSGDAECWCAAPDGFAELGDDCDDGRGDVNPDQEEVCLDGVDNNCDGVGCQLSGVWSDEDADGSAAGSGGASAGDAVALVGDLDGDGLADVGIGGPSYQDSGVKAGALWLSYGPASGTLELATESEGMWVGLAENDKVGRAVTGIGDVNGDGYPEVAVGAPNANTLATDGGAVYVVYGPASGVHSLSDADRSLSGVDTYQYAGRSLAGLGDATGDGVPDLLVGVPGEDGGGNNSGAALLMAGPFGGTGQLEVDAVATLLGAAANDTAGRAVSAAGDINGDGLAELFVGAYLNDDSGSNAGAAYVVLGGTTGQVSMADAHAILLGAAAGDGAGKALAGGADLNGDGNADLMVGSGGNDAGGAGSGAAYVLFGPVSGTVGLGDADVVLQGEAENDSAGTAVAAAGDMDGDGANELLVGAPGSDRVAEDGGAVYVIYGPPASGGLESAQVVIEGSGGGLGAALDGGQDIDGDGTPDFVIGAPDSDGGDGRALIFFGGGL